MVCEVRAMADNIFIADYLDKYFEELAPKDFYREIFPQGELAAHNEKGMSGKYNGVAVELAQDNGGIKRYLITDELDILDELLAKDNFIIISPISYAGRTREAAAARFIYGIAIDLDGVEKEQNLTDLFYQIENEILPKPTYMVWSGNGMHLYYKLEKPIPCFNNITRQLAKLKQGLTKEIWNKYVTTYYEQPQIQSLFQGFRMAGGVTKGGGRTRVFRTGEVVNIEYLNKFVLDKYMVKDITYKSKLTLSKASQLYPEWYEKRIVEQQPKGTWTCKRELYDWWKRRIMREAKAGHRYYCCMVLAIYAKKCGISREELEADAFSMIEPMELLTTDSNNHFTREDILAALELYNDSYITFPIDTIVQLTSLPIEKNKRNGRPQKLHLEIARNTLQALNNYNRTSLQGRPTKEQVIKEWQQANPTRTKAECIKETGLSKPTVYKYWS